MRTLLEHLAVQTYPAEAFEVLLVDNGSSDFDPPNTSRDNVYITHCHAAGSYAARNHGIERAHGDWLVFTDADCRPRPQWLQRMMDAASGLERPSDTILAGSIEMVARPEQRTIYEIYDLIRGIPQAWYVARGYATTANLAAHRDLLERIGRFDATRFSGGDAALCQRAVASGAGLIYLPEARVAHPARRSWSEVARKVRRIKGGQLHGECRRRQAQALLRTFMPPLIALARIAGRRDMPGHYRLLAGLVQCRIWGIEMHEALRLVLAGDVERR